MGDGLVLTRSKCLARVVVLSVLSAVGLVPAAVAQEQAPEQTEHFESNVDTTLKPWTHLDFYNDPKNFKFAIVSDRNGGMRPGIFPDAVRKLNLILPEFVMSVGDFISGNTADRATLEKEWAEFDAELKPLKVPFFFVPGNHDINNDVMRDVWNERSGVPYYSFVYKNVLFLALDSTGEKGDIVPAAQVESMKKCSRSIPMRVGRSCSCTIRCGCTTPQPDLQKLKSCSKVGSTPSSQGTCIAICTSGATTRTTMFLPRRVVLARCVDPGTESSITSHL